MNLRVERYRLIIEPGTFWWPEQDIAYIEDTLGLKKDGDSILLTRVNAKGLSCPAYLEARRVKNVDNNAL